MFTAKRQVATVVGNCLRMLPGSPVAGQRVLMYHAVGNRVDGDVNNIYTMSRTDFLRHIETLQEVSTKFNMPFAPFRQSNNTEIAITFDDGYADALSTIGPELLATRGIYRLLNCANLPPFQEQLLVRTVRLTAHSLLSALPMQKQTCAVANNNLKMFCKHQSPPCRTHMAM
jgi:hypothetical protein